VQPLRRGAPESARSTGDDGHTSGKVSHRSFED
jgi:hypothetical protein